MEGHTIISGTTQLNVQGDDESDNEDCDCVNFDYEAVPGGMILGVLTVFLIVVVVVLAVKIRKLQRAVSEEPQTRRNQDLGSDHLNYAALSFQAKPKDTTGLHQIERWSPTLCTLPPD
ncbi:hypothetical protein INR49_027967, partial [Caranx melampygus]